MKKPAASRHARVAHPETEKIYARLDGIHARLEALRDRELDTELRKAYRAVLDRLEALEYQIRMRSRTHVVPHPGGDPPPPLEGPHSELPTRYRRTLRRASRGHVEG